MMAAGSDGAPVGVMMSGLPSAALASGTVMDPKGQLPKTQPLAYAVSLM